MKASKRISPDFLYCFSRQARRSLENKMRLPCIPSKEEMPKTISCDLLPLGTTKKASLSKDVERHTF